MYPYLLFLFLVDIFLFLVWKALLGIPDEARAGHSWCMEASTRWRSGYVARCTASKPETQVLRCYRRITQLFWLLFLQKQMKIKDKSQPSTSKGISRILISKRVFRSEKRTFIYIYRCSYMTPGLVSHTYRSPCSN